MATLRVTEAFVEFSQGRPEVYPPDRLVDAKDPVVKGREQHFEPVEVAVKRTNRAGSTTTATETTSAAPGEKRARRRPARKRTVAKKAPAKPAEKKADKPTKSED
jgi:hypothetical protein